MIKAHNKQANDGSTIQDPTRRIKVKRSTDMFVDDSTLVHNKRKFNASEEDIMNVVQQDLKSWSDLLWTTGGLLELTKSKYFMMIWQFDRTGKPSLKSTEDIVPNTVR
eukprot:scaffold49701_cov71-Attheya_sp.AAC.1